MVTKKELQESLLRKALWMRFVVVALGIFLLDIFTKFLFKKDSFQTNGHFLDITFVQNIGTMWSLFSSLQAINLVFIIVSVIALLVVVFIFKNYFSKPFALSFGLIFAGILGNLHDRIFHGAVVDWINFHFWPVFNIADSAIVLGVILSVYFLFKDEF